MFNHLWNDSDQILTACKTCECGHKSNADKTKPRLPPKVLLNAIGQFAPQKVPLKKN